jgi:DNA-binding transcriptional regulator YiaG
MVSSTNNAPGDKVTPMPEQYMDTLLRAATKLGSTQELAERLRVEYEQLRKWMRGDEAPPHDIILRALELIKEPNGA